MASSAQPCEGNVIWMMAAPQQYISAWLSALFTQKNPKRAIQ